MKDGKTIEDLLKTLSELFDSVPEGEDMEGEDDSNGKRRSITIVSIGKGKKLPEGMIPKLSSLGKTKKQANKQEMSDEEE